MGFLPPREILTDDLVATRYALAFVNETSTPGARAVVAERKAEFLRWIRQQRREAWSDAARDFDDIIDAVRAQAKATALRDAASNVHQIDGRKDDAAAKWLRTRADQNERNPR